MNVCLLGLTGAGKTTVARLLARDLKLTHVSSGDIAREMAAEDPHAAVALDLGQMAPEEAMRTRVRAALEDAEHRGGWVLDGFPRDMAQLICLMDWTAMPSFVHLDANLWTVIRRLTSRQREDDTPDAIARRFVEHERATTPVVRALRAGGVLIELRVDGYDMDPGCLADDIKRRLF